MNAEKIEEKIAEYETKIAELKAELEANRYVYFPYSKNPGEGYKVEKFLNTSQYGQDDREIGWAFNSEEACARHIDSLKALAKLRSMPGRCKFSPDAWCILSEKTEQNFTNKVSYHQYFKADRSVPFDTVAIGGVWFKSKSDAEYAIEQLGFNELKAIYDDYLREDYIE